MVPFAKEQWQFPTKKKALRSDFQLSATWLGQLFAC